VRRNVRALRAVVMVSVLPTRPSGNGQSVGSHTLRGALPPVDLRAVCLVRAMVMLLLLLYVRLRGKTEGEGEAHFLEGWVSSRWRVTSVGHGRRAVSNGESRCGLGCLGGGGRRRRRDDNDY
jgi:hypothetical protein